LDQKINKSQNIIFWKTVVLPYKTDVLVQESLILSGHRRRLLTEWIWNCELNQLLIKSFYVYW